MSAFLISIGAGFSLRAGMVAVSTVRTVPTMHEQVAEHHQANEAKRDDRTNRHLEYKDGDEGCGESGQNYPYRRRNS